MFELYCTQNRLLSTPTCRLPVYDSDTVRSRLRIEGGSYSVKENILPATVNAKNKTENINARTRHTMAFRYKNTFSGTRNDGGNDFAQSPSSERVAL